MALSLGALDRARDSVEGLTIEVSHEEHFRPSPPVPTHRIEIGSTGGSE